VPGVAGNEPIGSWAWPASKFAGRDKGQFWVPDVDDPVIVTFRNGNPSYPRYHGGWWPKVDGSDNFVPEGAYTGGQPTKRIIKTSSGHELTFDDNPDDQTVKLIWADKANPALPKYSFVAFTADGNIQMATHVGSFFEMRAAEGDELNMMMDKHGNTIVQDTDGIKIIDKIGNVVDLGATGVQIISGGSVTINASGVNLKAGGVSVGDVATDSVVKGTTFIAWWASVFAAWLNTHTHGTGVGPSGPPLSPHVAPANALVLTDKLKTQ